MQPSGREASRREASLQESSLWNRGKKCACVCVGVPSVRNTEMGRFGVKVTSGASEVPLEVDTHSGSLGTGLGKY